MVSDSQQEEQQRELISVGQTSHEHSNEDLKHPRQLSPGILYKGQPQINRRDFNFCVPGLCSRGGKPGHGTPLLMELSILVKPACLCQHT